MTWSNGQDEDGKDIFQYSYIKLIAGQFWQVMLDHKDQKEGPVGLRNEEINWGRVTSGAITRWRPTSTIPTAPSAPGPTLPSCPCAETSLSEDAPDSTLLRFFGSVSAG